MIEVVVVVLRVISDMDEPTNTLMGAHGYCTQVSFWFSYNKGGPFILKVVHWLCVLAKRG